VVVTAANYSRMLARAGGGPNYSSLGNYRYSPYHSIPLPNFVSAIGNVDHNCRIMVDFFVNLQNTTNINMNATYPSSYGSFLLAPLPPPIDASCLQNLNWPQIYKNTFA
jgi:hypothetical protein